MARWRDWDDDDPGMVHDPEDEDWPDDWDDEPTMPCPHCRREILEDAERCPYCERYLSREDAPRPAQALVDHRRRRRVPLRRLSLERPVVSRIPRGRAGAESRHSR